MPAGLFCPQYCVVLIQGLIVIKMENIIKILVQTCFFLTLAGCGGSSVTLNWAAPTSRMDGSFLQMSEIGGYEIHYRLSSDDVSTVLIIDNPVDTAITLNNVYPGSYRVSMLTFDADGLSGQLSEELLIDIQ